MLAAYIALAITVQDVQLGTVDVGGTQVAVTLPDLRGPYTPKTPHVEIDGWNYPVGPDFSLGDRYRSDGGWGEVAEAYPAASRAAAVAPEYRVKVFLLTNSMVLEHGRDGVWRERTGSMSQADQTEVMAALARFKALAETAANGAVRVTFDVTRDDDLLFRVADETTREYRQAPGDVPEINLVQPVEDKGLLGPRFIQQEIAPHINNDPFEGEDHRYHGPYSSVFVVHAMRTWDLATYLIDRTPVTSVSWATFSDRKPGPALSIQLFYAWLQHLGVSARAHNHDLGTFASLKSGDALPGVPHVFATPLTPQLLALGNHLSSRAFGDGTEAKGPFTSEDAQSMRLERLPGATKTIGADARSVTPVEIDGKSGLAVKPWLAAKYMQAHPNAIAMGRLNVWGEEWQRVAFDPGDQSGAENDCTALAIKPTSVPAGNLVGQAPSSGQLEIVPFAVGDFEATLSTDPIVGQAVTVQENSYFRRGYVVLSAANPGQALFHVNKDTGVQFRVSCDLADAYVLRLVTKSGKQFDVQLYGDATKPVESVLDSEQSLDLSRKSGPFWSEFKALIGPTMDGEDVTEARLAPPNFAECYDRVSDGSKSLKIGPVSYGPMQNPDTAQPSQPNADLAWLVQLKGPLDDAAVQRVTALLDSQDPLVRMNAAGAMFRIKHADLIPQITRLATNPSPGTAYLAINAMRFQNDDRGWSQIAFTAFKGPEGFNYAFAAEALGDKQEDATLQILGVPVLQANWHSRLSAVRSMNKIDTEMGAIVASTCLSAPEPDAAVRFELVSHARPKSELYARRLLYAAVNDESEWVRAASYLSLIDSPFTEMRDQALKGVGDDSATVKLALLEAMRRNAKEYYRSALRSAVTDASPQVRAAALRAFATQPAEVVLGEVQNTLNDPSPIVRAALQELAKAKGLQIPPLP